MISGMLKLSATISKELLLLTRDKSGLLVLFLMPAVLVLVVSLVQENILKMTGETGIRILFVDKDQNALSQAIEKQLAASGFAEIVRTLNGTERSEERAKASVADGDFQFCVVIPAGMTDAVEARARQLVTASFSQDKSSEKEIPVPDLIVYFDPMTHGNFRSAVLNALHRVVAGMGMNVRARAFSELFPAQLSKLLEEMMGPEFTEGLDLEKEFPTVGSDWGSEPLLKIAEKQAAHGGLGKMPTSVQQNVPAWAIFGMFFIVVPMGGSLISERSHGTLTRLRTLPVSYLTVLSGKIIAYVLVCLTQFGIILLMGKFILPLLGSPELDMGSSPEAIGLVALSAAFAATGYGIMLGTLARTYDQASMFGAVSVVIAAALGGVMVPVFVMPKIMQQISVISPLGWGLNAFLDIFVRGGDVRSVLPEVLSLFSFFGVTLLIAWGFFSRQGRAGG